MSTIKNPKTLKEFVKSKVNDNPLFTVNKDKLIENLVHAIEKEGVINIRGAKGTGKRYIVDDIIVPSLKNYKNQEPNISLNINSSLSSDYEKLINNSDKTLIIYINEFSGSHSTDDRSLLVMKLNDISGGGFNIYWPGIQKLFLYYPEIIESYTKSLYNISMDQIYVGINGYLESLISGIPKNFMGLIKIIEYDDANVQKENMLMDGSNMDYLLTYNQYLDTRPERKNIWRSFWKTSPVMELSDIASFNKSFKNSWSNIIGDKAVGSFKKHHSSKVPEKIRNYCKSFFHHLNIKIDKKIKGQLFEPLNRLIKGIESGEYIISSRIENVYLPEYSDVYGFKQFEDFQTIHIDEDSYQLSTNQAAVLKYIYEKYSYGEEFRGSKVLHANQSSSVSLQPIFRSNPEFFKRFFICTNKKLGSYMIHPNFCKKIS